MKILRRFLIFGNIWENINQTMSLYLLIHDLSTTSHNNVQHDAKIKVIIIVIITRFKISALPNVFLSR